MVEPKVRFGGMETSGRFVFEVTGGALALDFVNTMDERRTSRIERLTAYPVLVDWAVQVGLVPADRTQRLLAVPAERSEEILRTATELREILFEMIMTLVKGERPSRALMGRLNALIARASSSRRLTFRPEGFAWSFGDPETEPEAILWHIVESAASIFASKDLTDRLRICGGPTCAWAFLDSSRRKNRRWCDMSVCGNRIKARRHYERRRSASRARTGGTRRALGDDSGDSGAG